MRSVSRAQSLNPLSPRRRESMSNVGNSAGQSRRVAVFLLMLAVVSPLAFAQDATLIVFNGKIVTVDEKDTRVEAMALKDDVIVALGKNDDILKMAGPNTRKLDAQGRMVMPGIV